MFKWMGTTPVHRAESMAYPLSYPKGFGNKTGAIGD
jgi:hypothetical protein